MRKILQKIYRQPKATRDTYAFMAAGVFTAVVCTIWVAARLQTPIDGGSIVRENASPFATLIKKSKEQFAALQAAVPESTSTSTETTTTGATTSATTIVLTEEEKAAMNAKASSTASTSTQLQYKEVLIGTTSASTTVQ